METVARRDQFNRRYKRNKDALEWLESVALAVVAVALVFTFGVRMIRVDGESMLPTLQDGERLLISSLPYEPSYGDIIIIDQYTEYGEPLVKRVIGIGGDTIDIDFQAGVVYRNGEPLDEPYTAEPTYLQESVTFPVTVPQGCLFVMGDNRNHSTDSRDTPSRATLARGIRARRRARSKACASPAERGRRISLTRIIESFPFPVFYFSLGRLSCW